MIFVTVGTQFDFPRLVQAVAALDLAEEVVAQIGPDPGEYPFQTSQFLKSDAFEAAFQRARLIVAHAGMGTVLAAKRLHKPLVLMPRRAAFGEHRNDHQLATAKRLEGRAGVQIAWKEEALGPFLTSPAGAFLTGSDHDRQQLLAGLRAFVNQSGAR